MNQKIRKKLEWDMAIIYLIRILFVIEFFAPLVIWSVQNASHSHIDVKFINMFTAVLGLSLTFLPKAVEKISRKRLKFSSALSFVIIVFIFAAEFLGEIKDFYDKFAWWDVMLHTVSGVILGLIGFMLIYILNESARPEVQLSPIFICFFAFCFALSCGALWEIFEFSGDRLFHMNMQKYLPPLGTTQLVTKNWRYDAGLIDTMTDIICDASSAFVTSLVGYISLKIRAYKLGKTMLNLSEEKEFVDSITQKMDFHSK